MSDTKARIAITLDADLLQRIDAVSEERGESRSAVMNRMFRNGIAEEEEFNRDMEKPVARAVLQAMTRTPGVLESIAALVGKQMSADEAADLKSHLQAQAERGKQRSKSKKSSKKQIPRTA